MKITWRSTKSTTIKNETTQCASSSGYLGAEEGIRHSSTRFLITDVTNKQEHTDLIYRNWAKTCISKEDMCIIRVYLIFQTPRRAETTSRKNIFLFLGLLVGQKLWKCNFFLSLFYWNNLWGSEDVKLSNNSQKKERNVWKIKQILLIGFALGPTGGVSLDLEPLV